MGCGLVTLVMPNGTVKAKERFYVNPKVVFLVLILFPSLCVHRRGVAMCSCEKRNISPAFLQRDPADGDPSDVRCYVCHFQQLQASQAFPRTQTGKAHVAVTITIFTTV